MTIQKSIEILKNERPGCGEKVIYTESERCESYDMAISALEKQISKKPIKGKNGDLSCSCGLIIQRKNRRTCLHYCHNCGQAIDWSDED